jgi:tRNA (adenine22-N1)-methyltransferase
MKFGKRLELIASKISKNHTVIDIGTDHAYLPIYLINEGISRKVIATEILPGPYGRARENIKKVGLEGFIELRLGSGFNPIKPKEGDIAVIAGMGAMTIKNILNESREKVCFFKKLILQPMRNQEKLRKYLLTTGYEIIDEDVAFEDKKYYEITVVKKAQKHLDPFDEIDVLVGPVMSKKRTPVVIEYINHRMKILQNLIESLNASNSEVGQRALKKYENQLKALREVVK